VICARDRLVERLTAGDPHENVGHVHTWSTVLSPGDAQCLTSQGFRVLVTARDRDPCSKELSSQLACGIRAWVHLQQIGHRLRLSEVTLTQGNLPSHKAEDDGVTSGAV
jgi:hypothetical protein